MTGGSPQRAGSTAAAVLAIVAVAAALFAVLEAAALAADAPVAATDAPHRAPQTLALTDAPEVVTHHWRFAIGPGDGGTYTLDAWVEYLLESRLDDGEGTLTGTITWRHEGQELHTSQHEHALPQGTGERSMRARFGPVEADQTVTIEIGEGAREVVTVDGQWMLSATHQGSGQVAITALDARLDTESDSAVHCQRIVCPVTFGSIAALAAAGAAASWFRRGGHA